MKSEGIFAGPVSRFLPANARQSFVDVWIIKSVTVLKKKI